MTLFKIVVLQNIVLLFLILASYNDLKTRRVSNKLISAIVISSTPLIYMNLSNITIAHIVIIIVLLYIFFTKKFGGIGGADVKAIIPITLSLTLYHILIMWVIILISDLIMRLKYKEGTPYFLAITLSYLILIIV